MLSALAVVLLLCCVCSGNAWSAQGIQLRNFVLDNRDGNITIRFSLDLNKRDRDQIEAMLLDGARLGLHCKAELYRKRNFWTSKLLAQGQQDSQLRADELSRVYVIKIGKDETQDKTLEKLLQRVWTDIQLNLGPFSMLQRGNEYFLDLDVSLKKDDVPAWMRWSLFFRSWEAVPGARYQMNFEY